VTLAAALAPLASRLVAARAAWPGVELADDDFAAYLAARLPEDGDLAVVCVEDLWLACATLRGDPAALRAFDAHARRGLGAAIAHLDGGSALVADVIDAVRARVLPVDAGGQARLAAYRGRGDLRGWIRVVAVREALQLLRARRHEAPLVDDLAGRLAADDAGATALTAAERASYRDAFRAALATLTPRARNLLRQQHLHGTTVDELGALYGVHRATAARWVQTAREEVLRATRRHVAAALRLTGAELDSVMARLGDHLEVSLRETLSHEAPGIAG
jgi:RNA polymerase sigma-70 factor (ECF subfamily)